MRWLSTFAVFVFGDCKSGGIVKILTVGFYWVELCGNSVSSYIALVISIVSFSAMIWVLCDLSWLC